MKPRMQLTERKKRSWRRLLTNLPCVVALLAALSCASPGGSASGGGLLPARTLPSACQPTDRAPFQVPSDKGLNYGEPADVSGGYLGTRWLRPNTLDGWPSA